MNGYKILDEATADLAAAATWYEQQREGLGLEVLVEFRQQLTAALEMLGTGAPAWYTPGGSEIHRFRLRRFKPYAILIATIDELPTVLAFEHSSRRPGYRRQRVKA